MLRRSILGLGLAALAASVVPESRAAMTRYQLDVPDGADTAFEIQVLVERPGPLVVNAEWAGPRILSFRLEGPGAEAARERRSGPSPQRMELTVTDPALAAGGEYRLAIRALAGKGPARGTLTVLTPEAPEIVAEKKRAEEPPPPPPPVPDPWTLPARAPAGASLQVGRVFEAVERFRSLVVGSDGRLGFDACSYRADLLERLAAWRDASVDGAATLSGSSIRYLERLDAALREVEGLRTTSDPMLAGPPPSDPLRRKAWLQIRLERIRPLERELDALTEALRGGYAPDFESETWPARLLACATACERHFEGKGRGEGDAATNAELAAAQWGTILAALDALDAIAAAPGAGSARAR
jgi:hypothetical protein